VNFFFIFSRKNKELPFSHSTNYIFFIFIEPLDINVDTEGAYMMPRLPSSLTA
jgi:hypothetical protein